jgi:hypothetical protein
MGCEQANPTITRLFESTAKLSIVRRGALIIFLEQGNQVPANCQPGARLLYGMLRKASNGTCESACGNQMPIG